MPARRLPLEGRREPLLHIRLSRGVHQAQADIQRLRHLLIRQFRAFRARIRLEQHLRSTTLRRCRLTGPPAPPPSTGPRT